jgi:hypothetical protein
MALLYGCAGRLTSKNGGFRPGQVLWFSAPMMHSGRFLWNYVHVHARWLSGLWVRHYTRAIIYGDSV